MTGCGETNAVTYPCADIGFAASVGAQPESCPLSRAPDTDQPGPPSYVLGESAMARGHVAVALKHFDDALDPLPFEPSAVWQLRALAGQGYGLSLLGEIDAAARSLERLRATPGHLKREAAPAIAFVLLWRLAALDRVDAAIEVALEAARRANAAGQFGTETLLSHQAVRLGDTTSLDRLAVLAEERVCRRARLASAHARALNERTGTGLSTVASCFAAAAMPLEAIDARSQAVAVLRDQGASASAWEAFGLAHQERSRCGQITTPAWRASRMPLPLSEDEHDLATLTASGFTVAAIARRMQLSHDDVERTLRCVYAKLRVSDRQALATVIATATEDAS